MPAPGPESAPARALRLTVPTDVPAAREACRSVRRFLDGMGLDADEAGNWELALVEITTNLARHARAAAAGSFQLDILCGPTDVEARLTDHTPGFEWPEEITLPPPDQESGRGLFIVRALVEQVSYLRGPGENCLVLRKRRVVPGTVLATEAALIESLRDQARELEATLDGMTEELASSYESLTAIFKFSEHLGRQSDLREFARSMLDHLLRVTDADRYLLRLRDPGSGRLEPFAVSGADILPEPLNVDDAAARASLESRAALARQDLWLEGGTAHVAEWPPGFAGVRAGLVHPFFLNDRLIGTLAIGRTRGAPQFRAGQVSIIHTFADFLALQVLHARSQDEQLRGRLVSRELEIAATIQRALLPVALPRPRGFSLAGFCQSARQVGGDFYDAFETADGGLLLAIADVMGKGVPAAMLAAILRTVIRSQAELASRPAELLQRANELIFADLDRVEMFITAQLVWIHPAERVVRCAGAGHCPLLIGDAGAGADRLVAAEGPPLGIAPTTRYTATEVELAPGASLLLYTDGVYEVPDDAGELWGLERLREWWRRARADGPDAATLQQRLIAAVSAHRGTAAATDDLTFLVLAGHPPSR